MSHAAGQDMLTGVVGVRVDRYAVARGERVDTIRKRIQRGQLAGYKGDDHRWYVLESVARDAAHGATRRDTGQDKTGWDFPSEVVVNLNPRAQLEAIRDEWLRPLVDTIAAQAERIGRLEAERDVAGVQLAARDELIAELRRRAEVAERALGLPEVSPAKVDGSRLGLWGRLRTAVGI